MRARSLEYGESTENGTKKVKTVQTGKDEKVEISKTDAARSPNSGKVVWDTEVREVEEAQASAEERVCS